MKTYYDNLVDTVTGEAGKLDQLPRKPASRKNLQKGRFKRIRKLARYASRAKTGR